jgi:hypothetical protein
MTAILVVERDVKGARDKLRAYKIFVDGRRVGSVRRGGTRETTVEPGVHVVQLRIDWCSSREVEVEIPDGGRSVLRCRPGGGVFTTAVAARYD